MGRHGIRVVTPERSYDGLHKFLRENCIEGLVFWKGGEPRYKIKHRDYELLWNKGNPSVKVMLKEGKTFK